MSKIKPAEIDHIKEFHELVSSARREPQSSSGKINISKDEHDVAIAYAREHNLYGAEVLLQASLLERESKSVEALQLLEIPPSNLHPSLECLRWFLKARVLDQLGQFEAAIEAYNKVLADIRYVAPGKIWNNIGVAYSRMQDYDAAEVAPSGIPVRSRIFYVFEPILRAVNIPG